MKIIFYREIKRTYFIEMIVLFLFYHLVVGWSDIKLIFFEYNLNLSFIMKNIFWKGIIH